MAGGELINLLEQEWEMIYGNVYSVHSNKVSETRGEWRCQGDVETKLVLTGMMDLCILTNIIISFTRQSRHL